jgi:uncharacterized protein (TIGR00290 family)
MPTMNAATTPPDDAETSTSVVLMWSGGKDALLALCALTEAPSYTVEALLTTVVEDEETVTMHGTPLTLIRKQAEALGYPLQVMRVPPSPSNPTYEVALERALDPLRTAGAEAVAAGDLYLDDVRTYRESVFRQLGMDPVFPLWGDSPARLADRFVTQGYRAVVTSVDTTQLEAGFAGRMYDEAFLSDVPGDIDPCGEKGAFHTFVTDGPRFREAVPVTVGRVSTDGRMAYAQLQPA